MKTTACESLSKRAKATVCIATCPPAVINTSSAAIREDGVRDGRAAVRGAAVRRVPERVVAVRGYQLVVAALVASRSSSAWLVGCAKELERLYCSPSRSFLVTALWRLDHGSVSAAIYGALRRAVLWWRLGLAALVSLHYSAGERSVR